MLHEIVVGNSDLHTLQKSEHDNHIQKVDALDASPFLPRQALERSARAKGTDDTLHQQQQNDILSVMRTPEREEHDTICDDTTHV